jgi:hypothetical protein
MLSNIHDFYVKIFFVIPYSVVVSPHSSQLFMCQSTENLHESSIFARPNDAIIPPHVGIS